MLIQLLLDHSYGTKQKPKDVYRLMLEIRTYQMHVWHCKSCEMQINDGKKTLTVNYNKERKKKSVTRITMQYTCSL